jgi:hypothetical protein
VKLTFFLVGREDRAQYCALYNCLFVDR